MILDKTAHHQVSSKTKLVLILDVHFLHLVPSSGIDGQKDYRRDIEDYENQGALQQHMTHRHINGDLEQGNQGNQKADAWQDQAYPFAPRST